VRTNANRYVRYRTVFHSEYWQGASRESLTSGDGGGVGCPNVPKDFSRQIVEEASQPFLSRRNWGVQRVLDGTSCTPFNGIQSCQIWSKEQAL
jgi:hypothetical protein